MFIESLFNFPGVEVVQCPDQHYQIRINHENYKALVPKLQDIFYTNYEQLTLLQRSREFKIVLLVVLWRHVVIVDGHILPATYMEPIVPEETKNGEE